MIFLILLGLVTLTLAGIIVAARVKNKQMRRTVIVSVVLFNIVSAVSLFYLIRMFGGGRW